MNTKAYFSLLYFKEAVAGSVPHAGTHTDINSLILQLHYLEYITSLVAAAGEEILENYAWVLNFSQLARQD